MGQYKSGSVGCVLYFDIEFLSEHYVKCCAEKIEKRNQSFMEKPRKCNVCGKSPAGRNYWKHLQTHSKNKLCAKCPKKFSNNWNLASHIRQVHEGVYRYIRACSICGEGFKNSIGLKRHLYRKHGEGDPKLCPQCGYSGPTARDMKEHMLCHKDPSHKCNHCGKMCRTKHSLEEHERLHTGERPYTCSICGSGFPSSGGLGQHKRGVHKIAGPLGGKLGWSRKGKKSSS